MDLVKSVQAFPSTAREKQIVGVNRSRAKQLARSPSSTYLDQRI